MPPLSDSPNTYLPSHVTTAASRILAAYLSHHRVSAVEAARLAVRVESLLTDLMAGHIPIMAAAPAEAETAPRRAGRAAPAKAPRAARARPMESQSALDFREEAEAETAAETATEVAAAAPAPEPAAPPVELPEEPPEEIDLLTGGPLPPAREADYPMTPQTSAAAEPSATPGKKRKRPPRPASRRRAARVAAIEQMLVDGADED